jgi:hypothetical protein
MTFVKVELSACLPAASQLGWAAGFVDGEGCVRIARRNPGPGRNRIYSLELSISQNMRSTLEHFQSIFPDLHGSLRLHDDGPHLRRPVFVLNYRCAQCLDLLLRLEPFLVRKKAEAQCGIEFARGVSFVRRGRTPHPPEQMALRETFFQRMSALK